MDIPDGILFGQKVMGAWRIPRFADGLGGLDGADNAPKREPGTLSGSSHFDPLPRLILRHNFLAGHRGLSHNSRKTAQSRRFRLPSELGLAVGCHWHSWQISCCKPRYFWAFFACPVSSQKDVGKDHQFRREPQL